MGHYAAEMETTPSEPTPRKETWVVDSDFNVVTGTQFERAYIAGGPMYPSAVAARMQTVSYHRLRQPNFDSYEEAKQYAVQLLDEEIIKYERRIEHLRALKAK